VEYAETRRVDPATESPGRPSLDAGRLLAAVGAVALLVSLFLDWYGDVDSESAVSAWTSFEIVDVLLAAIGLAVLYAAAEGLASAGRIPVVPESLLRVAGPAALVLIVVSLIDPPPLFGAIDPGREVGIWIALAAAILITLGALLTTMRISVVVSARDRPRAAEPAAETRPLDTDPPTRS
jgi:ABC-type amino acid transport substrate-binding protein